MSTFEELVERTRRKYAVLQDPQILIRFKCKPINIDQYNENIEAGSAVQTCFEVDDQAGLNVLNEFISGQ